MVGLELKRNSFNFEDYVFRFKYHHIANIYRWNIRHKKGYSNSRENKIRTSRRGLWLIYYLLRLLIQGYKIFNLTKRSYG